VLPQYVISQSIAAGTQFTQQTQVTITVSGFTVINQPSIPTPVP
jgi:beta-lactam-binding protein with PASTA domain